MKEAITLEVEIGGKLVGFTTIVSPTSNTTVVDKITFDYYGGTASLKVFVQWNGFVKEFSGFPMVVTRKSA
jgi:hypothetical protein